jgi:hypothetical protein
MERIAKGLHEKMTRYNWAGFYLVDPTDAGYLIVGPFAGSFIPNARIPLNTGLCGAAASSAQVVVVQDVSKIRAISRARRWSNRKSLSLFTFTRSLRLNSISKAISLTRSPNPNISLSKPAPF